MEVLYHIRPYFVGMFPYIGLKNRPKIYGIGTSNESDPEMASEKMEESSEMMKILDEDGKSWDMRMMRTAIFYDRNFEWTSPFFQLEILTWQSSTMAGVVEQLRPHPRMKNQVILRFLKPPSIGHLSGHLEKATHCFGGSRWCPLQLEIGYKAINDRYITNKNHSFWSYVHQLSYRKRGHHLVQFSFKGVAKSCFFTPGIVAGKSNVTGISHWDRLVGGPLEELGIPDRGLL